MFSIEPGPAGDLNVRRVQPLRDVNVALVRAASAVRRGEEAHGLDIEAMRAKLDATLTLLLERRRHEIINSVGVRAGRAASELLANFNGETRDAFAMVGEIMTLRAALDLVGELVGEGRPDDRLVCQES